MVSIIIYTTKNKLLHKQDKLKFDEDKSDCGEYYWEFSNLPKRFDIEKDRIYFAVQGFIVGYFEPVDNDNYSIFFDSKSWKDIQPIPTKSFQGFKYADKVEGLE
jgi:hypothetical protein